jgi:hypothetical protein
LLTVDYETFSVMYTPPPPPKKYTYDDMLSIERQRAAQQSKVSYIAVDDQNYKVFAILSKATETNKETPPVALQLASAIGLDVKDKGIFYGFTSDLASLLAKNNRIDLVTYISGNVANILYALYPYIHIKTFSLQTLAPRKYAKQDAFIDLVKVPMAWVDGLHTNDSIKKPLGEYTQNVQQFYAMFVPFSHSPPINETFTDVDPINLKISVPLESIKVLKMVRDVNTRLSVYALEVSGHLGGVKLEVGDQLLLLNQKHRSIDGIYYVVNRNKDVIVLESTKNTDANPNPGDRVYDSVTQLGGILDDNEKVVYLNDVTTRAQKESCISNPNIKTRTMCESRFDLFGKPKKELDVWDRPCEYDNDCPFFNVSNFRGGCILGVCEMPLGAKQVGFRKYVVEEAEHLNLWTLSPFQGAIKKSEPIELFTQQDNAFHPGDRPYVYFANQPNAPVRDTELREYLNKVIGHKTEDGKELSTLLEVSGLSDLNYYIPIHKQVSATIWQCVIYKFETVEGHTVQFEVINNVFTSMVIMGRVPEQVIHSAVSYSSA